MTYQETKHCVHLVLVFLVGVLLGTGITMALIA